MLWSNVTFTASWGTWDLFSIHRLKVNAKMDRRVQYARQIIANDLRHSPKLSELASSVNLSPSRLSHLFKTETGVSLGRYLKRARMDSARHLLTTSFLTVKQVMVSVGINDISHFARCFKDTYGLTPTEYRSGIASSILSDSSAKEPPELVSN